MKPCGFDVYLKYICDCETEHWVTQEESKGQYTIVCGFCGKRHTIKPIKRIRVLIDFESCNKQTNKMAIHGVKLANQAYGPLKDAGFKRADVDSFALQTKAKTLNEFIKEFLASQN